MVYEIVMPISWSVSFC